jgi:molybdopterin-biosynthesis enzyme MoeA-like protein
MAIGLIIIGDEIMSGKRTDQHFAKVLEILHARGLHLDWAEYIGDDSARITVALRRAFDSGDIVFSCGGIGATPDDRTRQCAAEALEVELVIHPDARDRIRERIAEIAAKAGEVLDYDSPDNLRRLKMGEFPRGARIIPNPINKIPGFAVGTVHFVPGFPQMAAPMIEWALDTWHSALFHKERWLEKSVLVYDGMEASLTPLMETIEARFTSVKIFSLPHLGDSTSRNFIELGVKGEPQQVESAYTAMLDELNILKSDYKEIGAQK